MLNNQRVNPGNTMVIWKRGDVQSWRVWEVEGQANERRIAERFLMVLVYCVQALLNRTCLTL